MANKNHSYPTSDHTALTILDFSIYPLRQPIYSGLWGTVEVMRVPKWLDACIVAAARYYLEFSLWTIDGVCDVLLFSIVLQILLTGRHALYVLSVLKRIT